MNMDATYRRNMNALQENFPVCDEPFARAAAQIGITAEELIARIERMLESGAATRFGPLYNVERMGGAFTLAAMAVPEADFDRIAAMLAGMAEVAHNYAREHEFNMWFVLAAESPHEIEPALRAIERETGYAVLDLPKEREYFVNLKLDAGRAAS